MTASFRSLVFGTATTALLALFFLVTDISQVGQGIQNHRASGKLYLQSLPLKSNRNLSLETNPSTGSNAVDHKLLPSASNTAQSSTDWNFNKTLSKIIRKNILKFLDAERDISILKGILKPGDVIHYVFDRQSTMNVSSELYKLLPRVSPLKNQFHKRCAIVGNSGILLNSSCGQEIDSNDFVIRCNLAPVEEYERDVGRRTSLVTMNPSVVQRAFQDLTSEQWKGRFLKRLRGLNGSILWIPAFMAKSGEERVAWAVHLILQQAINVHTAFPSLRLLHAVRGYWLTNKVQIKRPTTGLLMYTMATRFCEQIHLYGFWPFHIGPQGNPVKYHYYDTLTYEYTSQAGPHTMPLEFETLSTLHRRGALRLHIETCNVRMQSISKERLG